MIDINDIYLCFVIIHSHTCINSVYAHMEINVVTLNIYILGKSNAQSG